VRHRVVLRDRLRPVRHLRLPVLTEDRRHIRRPSVAYEHRCRLRAAPAGLEPHHPPGPHPRPLGRHAPCGRFPDSERGPWSRPDPHGLPDGKPTGLGDAFAHYGRIFKTLRLLRFVSDGAAVKQLAAHGFPVTDELPARLSPLRYDHIDFPGRYAFTRTAAPGLRPLRDSYAHDESDDGEAE
jgi:hypothetical protein